MEKTMADPNKIKTDPGNPDDFYYDASIGHGPWRATESGLPPATEEMLRKMTRLSRPDETQEVTD